MPLDSHCSIRFSKSIMFVAPRYKIGSRLFAVAMFNRVIIGDVFVLPAANQFSVSATQKSESVCAAMA